MTANTSSKPTAANSAATIAMIGDSITRQGRWVELLGRDDVINWGHPGYTTGQIAWTFKDLVRQQPALKVVFLSGGTNDLLLGVPVDRIFENQVAAIRYWRERDITPVLQSLLHQVDAPDTNALISSLNARLRAHCAAEKVRFLDLIPVLCEREQLRAEHSTDGTHLKQTAYPLWADSVKRELIELGY
jgi:alpha-glucosidase